MTKKYINSRINKKFLEICNILNILNIKKINKEIIIYFFENI